MNNLFKYFSRILIGTTLLALLSAEGLAQNFSSPISWHHAVFEARVSALGQSTAALQNNTSYNLNPAVPSENGVLSASSFLISAKAVDSPMMDGGLNLYSPAISFSHRRFSYSAMLDYSSYTIPIPPESGGGDYTNGLFRFQTGYQISENFSVGAGFLYSSYSSPLYDTFDDLELGGDATAWGIDIGAYYKNQFESDSYRFLPQIGLAINDLSDGFDFDRSGEVLINLPGQIRLGFGLDVSSKNLTYNRSSFGAGIYAGFSKYLSRWEVDEETGEINVVGGFEALFTTWNSFERFDGLQLVEISLDEQISTSIGLEFHLLETFYLRYGTISGSDYWIRPQSGFGAEIDLFYVSLALTHINYHSSVRWRDQNNSTYVQATVRIPLDGQSRDTLLGRFFNR